MPMHWSKSQVVYGHQGDSMDEFIGHLDEERIQRLEDHLAETARLAGLFQITKEP